MTPRGARTGLGLYHTETSLLKRAGREPRLITIVRLARALKIRPTDLCYEASVKAAERRPRPRLFESKRRLTSVGCWDVSLRLQQGL
jgi:hypothetical protein